MPNHFTTIALCARDWNRLEQQGKDEHDFSDLPGKNLCDSIAPLPVELMGTAKRRYDAVD